MLINLFQGCDSCGHMGRMVRGGPYNIRHYLDDDYRKTANGPHGLAPGCIVYYDDTVRVSVGLRNELGGGRHLPYIVISFQCAIVLPSMLPDEVK